MKESRTCDKAELAKALQENVEKVTGLKISLVDVWNIFKVCIYTPFEIANKENARVTIPKIGVFTTSRILESYAKSQVVRPKFYGSEGMEDIMTNGGSLIEMLENCYTAKGTAKLEGATKESSKAEVKKEVKKEAPKAEAKKEVKKEAPKAEAKKEAPKAEAKKVTPVKKAEPIVKDIEIEEIEEEVESTENLSEDDFDFEDIL